MNRRLKWLIAVHLALSAGQLGFAFSPPNVHYLPLMWSLFAIPLSQVMLLGFWGAMGTNRLAPRLTGILGGCAYVALWMLIVDFLVPGDEDFGLSASLNRFYLIFATFLGGTAMVGGGFSVMRRWFTELRYLPASEPMTQPHRLFRFSILHLMLLTSAVSIVLGLTRGARTAESPESEWFAAATMLLTCVTLLLNTLVAAWAALATTPYRLKLVLVFVVAVLLGISLSLALNREFDSSMLPSWFFLNGLFVTIPPTAIVVASLLVVRACGYRLVKKVALETA